MATLQSPDGRVIEIEEAGVVAMCALGWELFSKRVEPEAAKKLQAKK